MVDVELRENFISLSEPEELEPVKSQQQQALRQDNGSHKGNGFVPMWAWAVAALFIIVGVVLCFIVSRVLGVIAIVCLLAQCAALVMGKWVLSIGEGSENMKMVGDAIREGSESYVKTMFGTIFTLLLVGVILIFVLYLIQTGNFLKSLMITMSFILGAICSSLSGIIGMWSSTRANSRVAQNSCQASFRSTIVVALRSGCVAGIVVVSMAVLGISILFSFAKVAVLKKDESLTEVPVMLVGYGFGASFVAMFAQLGGGIYTKAADVGADLCGKIEFDIPEDDPRNPAVIADLVGDNVGDCCARGADLFESLSAEIIAAMILGASLMENLKKDSDNAFEGPDKQMQYMLFPLVVHVVDLIVSTLGVMSVRPYVDRPKRDGLEDPMAVMKKGYIFAVILAAIGFGGTTRYLLYTKVAPDACLYFLICGLIGMVAGFLVVLITQYYTDFKHAPVRSIARAAESGHGTNVIAGLAVGFESTMLPVITISAAIISTYYLGQYSGLETTDPKPRAAAGLFGTAVATMGMLSNLTYVLAMDIFGPITDNAAGIVEMSPDCPESARTTMDALDAVGNTTKAFTKGFAVSSAGLASFLLFRAFLDIAKKQMNSDGEIQVDIVQPEVFIGGIFGAATVYLFAAYAMQAVGSTAQLVVSEVRRQFCEMPGISTGAQKPDYGKCVSIVSQAAIRHMVKPGLLVTLMPVAIGGGFRLLGASTGNHLLGAQAMTAYLVCSSMAAILMALFLNNGGGAWDNAKKYIEAGNHGGKGSDAHKAAVTGDTVGDPCKDTAGPSLHVLMKLTATVTMIVGPLVAIPHGAK